MASGAVRWDQRNGLIGTLSATLLTPWEAPSPYGGRMRRNPRVWQTTGVGAGHGLKPRGRDADDALVRAHYPNINRLLVLLPTRSKPAIKAGRKVGTHSAAANGLDRQAA